MIADRTLVDGFVNLLAAWTYSLGVSLHAIQTGRIRQYVMFIVDRGGGDFRADQLFLEPDAGPLGRYGIATDQKIIQTGA